MNNEIAEKLFVAIKRFNKAGFRHRTIEGVKPSEVMVMFCLKKKKNPDTAGLRVSEISELLGVTSPTVTQLIRELEAKGYIERKMDQEDRRAVRIRLSDKGEVLIEEALAVTESSFIGLIEYLGEEDSNQLANLLIKACEYYDQKEISQNESGESNTC